MFKVHRLDIICQKPMELFHRWFHIGLFLDFSVVGRESIGGIRVGALVGHVIDKFPEIDNK